MDDGSDVHNPFSSSHVWKQTATSEDVGTYESSLFAPLELDSKFWRVICAQTRCTLLITHSHLNQV